MSMQRIERGDLWKNKARVLQFQLRNRFRVAVDHHRPIFADGYFSSTVNRWLTRFRDFKRESLQSSSVFYRKRVSKDFSDDEESMIVRMVRSVTVPLIGNVCHVFMNGLNRVQVFGVEKLHEALLNRPINKPLLTVSNHVASVDDPFVIASLLPPRVMMDAQNLRWTLCATDRCFKNPVTSAFFSSVKVLPVSRGDGIYQKGMDLAIAKLNSGGWVHIFPEGSRSRDGGKTMGSSKRGVGRLVLDADTIPMVIPVVHTGMQDIMPIGANFPKIGKTVTVLVGDPIHFDDLLNVEGADDTSRGNLYDAVASRIGRRLQDLKVQVERIAALEQSVKLQNTAGSMMTQVAGMVQQVDWDSFGMGINVVVQEDEPQRCRTQPAPVVTFPHKQTSSDHSFRTRSSSSFYEGGMISQMRGYMDSAEFLGFAAKGLFVNRKEKERSPRIRDVGPLREWYQFLEDNLTRQWESC